MICLICWFQFRSSYERYAYDTISTLDAVVSRMESLGSGNFSDHINNISFNGTSVSSSSVYSINLKISLAMSFHSLVFFLRCDLYLSYDIWLINLKRLAGISI